MLDIIMMKEKTTLECQLQELPSSIQNIANKFLAENEESIITIINKGYREEFFVIILTPFRVIRIYNSIKNGNIGPANSLTIPDVSCLISDLSGFKIHVMEKEKWFDLSLIIRSNNYLELYDFYSEALFDKFTKAILQIQIRRN
jgi:hypothetical protein